MVGSSLWRDFIFPVFWRETSNHEMGIKETENAVDHFEGFLENVRFAQKTLDVQSHLLGRYLDPQKWQKAYFQGRTVFCFGLGCVGNPNISSWVVLDIHTCPRMISISTI